ncbi:MAG: hypothetical protein B7O98_09465 [Zestosphaera tikiterensis]|uniref:Uncharacterized protein n=1 Tax=Zestosphaera tikiterensis TaxID=1973259 RepID=A0A2R7Y1A3_9CREN|nr:MAG: hypothetical protein B7O98_09465 [Zestosphaera tikiterensis]
MSTLPDDYYTYRFEEANRYLSRLIKIKELEDAFLRIRYVFGGTMWFFGILYYFDKNNSSTLEADDINNVIDFLEKYSELLKEVA